MSNVTPSILEATILSALADLSAGAGGRVRTLRGFGDGWETARRSLAVASPAVLVRHAGRRPPTPGAGQLGGWSRWIVTVAVGGGRAESGRRAGFPADGADAEAESAWGLLEAVRARLRACAPASGCGPFLLRDEAPARDDAGWAVWEQTWECSIPAADATPPLMALAEGGPSADVENAAADQTEFNVGEQAGDFVVGEPIFAGTTAGAQTRSLGLIVEIESGVVVCSQAPVRAYASGARLWSPSTWHAWSVGRCAPLVETWDRGTSFAAYGGGGGAATRIRAARRTTQFGVGPVAAMEIAAFRAWLDAALRGGLDPFTWVDERRDTAVARIVSATWTEEETDDGLARLAFDMALEETGGRV